jgi:CDP-glucose 4,6-dehydratase
VEDVVVDASAWRGRRVLVTGHTGFKGGWLALWLEVLGAEVTGLSLPAPPTHPSFFELARVEEGLRSLAGDVRQYDTVREAVAVTRPEVVFHLAAQPLVRHSLRDPLGTYATNVMGTVHMLEAVREVGGARAVVNVTSDKCYAERGPGRGHREDDPLGGLDPYSSSKAASELVTEAYRASLYGPERGPALASARAGNVIGGGDWGEDRLVPDLVRAALRGEVLRVRHPDAVRPWQHVLNAVSGYLVLAQALLDSPAAATAWNFGPDEGDARPVADVVARLSTLWGGRPEWTVDAGTHPREAPHLALDSTRAREQLGWAPTWDLERALEAVVAWHRAVAAGEDARAVSLSQVGEFVADGPPAPAASPAGRVA